MEGFALPILADVSRASLDLLKGATFSGELKAPLGLEIKVREHFDGERDSLETIDYHIGKSDLRGRARRWKRYG
jgi:hypothetical protein